MNTFVMVSEAEPCYTSTTSIPSIPMNPKTLSMHGQGVITLPKEWRDKYHTKSFMAIETAEGLLIKPIEEVQYYERKDGSFGLHFPFGIEAGRLAEMMATANKKIDAEEQAKKKKRSQKKRRG